MYGERLESELFQGKHVSPSLHMDINFGEIYLSITLSKVTSSGDLR